MEKLKRCGEWLCIYMCCLEKVLTPYDYTVEVRNSFKALDLIDTVPEEIWTEVRDIVQETGSKTIPKEEKCKKAKWLSEEALQIAEKGRDTKRKDISI